MNEEDYCYCHYHDDTYEYFDCLDYMECDECPYYYADEDQEEMMERLTKTYSDGTHGANDNLPCGENSYTYKGLLLEALGKYEDAEEQGLLLRLPCKVGDTVWDNDYGKPCVYTITGFSFGTGEDYIDDPVSLKEVVCYYSNYNGSITGSFAVSEIGKTVFLTREEAEQKLKEMESE